MADLSEKQAKFDTQKQEFSDLKKQVATFEQTLEKAVKKAIDDTEKSLEKDFASDQALEKQKHATELTTLQARVKALEEVVASQKQEIERLHSANQLSQKQLSTIAERAVSHPAPAAVHVQPTSGKE